jgi:hypothetical protein
MNTLAWLNMYGTMVLINLKTTPSTVKKSYWMYMEDGFFKVPVALKQHLKKGDRIAFVRDAFGSV